jgi:hypothetical protein
MAIFRVEMQPGGIAHLVMDHPNRVKYRHQMVLVVRIQDYAYLVPYVESENEMFLKSIMPSRKATRHFLSGDK